MTDVTALQALLGHGAAPCRRGITGETGVRLPAFTDHHVHLHLIDATNLTQHGIAAVVDLGGDPGELARRTADAVPHVSSAGAFLTAAGGYPAGRPWAPDAIVREVTSASPHLGVPGGAATAVDEQISFGATVIKVALNCVAGPVWDADLLTAVVALAHDRGLPVVAHVEGGGMLQLALDAGVDVLAHTPFTEVATPELVDRAVAAGQRWISTLDIHGDADAEIAAANLAAFHAAGGQVLYGTDLGNGERPAGIQLGELLALDAAGVRGSSLIGTLVDPWPLAEALQGVATFIPGPAPTDLDGVAAWLAGAIVVPTEELVHGE